jgi:protein-disulfide isomerase
MSDRKILFLAMALVVVVLVGGGIGFQAWRTNRSPKAPAATAVAQQPVAITDGQPIRLGNAAAATVDLYEDFHCPHCADFEEEFGPTLTKATELDQIQIQLYPMAFIDSGSTRAANAMACAAEAGFGGSYYLGLFANHALEWNESQLVDLAGKVGATATPEFSSCVTAGSHQTWVDSINAAADTNGVTGTPTMFINGSAVDLNGLTPGRLGQMFADAAKK